MSQWALAPYVTDEIWNENWRALSPRPPLPSHRFFGLLQNSLASPAHRSDPWRDRNDHRGRRIYDDDYRRTSRGHLERHAGT
jgi:hypothetical protein